MTDQHPMVAWLDAVLTEIERVAQASMSARESMHEPEPGVWTRPEPFQPDEDVEPTSYPDVYGDIRIYDEGGHSNEQADHIALHDPRAVLARVAAERKLIALHSPIQRHRTIYHGFNLPPSERYSAVPIDGVFLCDLCSDSDDGAESWPCPTVCLLAWGHRYDAPGWQTEWAPEGVSADA